MMLAHAARVLSNVQVFYSFLIFGVTVASYLQSRQTQYKRQQAVWRIECELGIISDADCPVDGAWTTWGPWSACHGPCDDIGHRRRTRQCTNPPASEDGLPCNGPEEDIETCFITNCTSKDYRQLIVGDSTRIQAFHELEVVPALMERCLQKDCRFEAIETALASDNTWHVCPEMIWNALQCVKRNLGCPVNGEWGNWGQWSECGARCGHGLRWRVRKCDTPPPSSAKLLCSGTPLQVEKCEGNQCLFETGENKIISIGEWSVWSNWTTCSESCGTGVRRRRRYCVEKPSPHPIGTWGTHCVGQHDQFEVCEPKKCQLDGGWSGWSTWGPCSQTCGAGKRFRTRSCTRPIPTGEGKDCVGPKTEFGTCYLSACGAFSHIVVLLNGDSFLQYKFNNKRSTLIHFYVRFMPLSPHGTLIRRGSVHNPLVRLSLQKWHICLDATGTSSSCTIPRICSHTALEAEKWHSALITVTNEAATLRLNDAVVPIKASFPCDPELPNEKIDIFIGERFHGEIQEMTLNFIPLEMAMQHNRQLSDLGFRPFSTSNLVFNKARIEEVYLHLYDGQYARLPCFDDRHEWCLELTIKTKKDSGTILFLKDDQSDTWFHVALQNSRLKLKIAVRELRSESISVSECLPDQWLDVTLSKYEGTNIIEAIINDGERLHVFIEEDAPLSKTRYAYESNLTKSYDIHDQNIFVKQDTLKPEDISLSICNDEFFIGGVPFDISQRFPDEIIPFSGVVSSLSINKNLQDLHTFNVERYNEGHLQVSSRTASISGSYHETFWGNSNQLNLTCVHARSIRSPHAAHWLYLDTEIRGAVKGKTVRAIDDGKLLKLHASANDDLKGFYTCRAHNNKYTRNVVTYGVIGKLKYDFSHPATTGAIAIITTFSLVLITLGWLALECIHDLRDGFGFFRDAHLTPEQEADAVCKYIDDNVHLIGHAAAEKAKSVARQKARRQAAASRANFGAQEPQGLLQVANVTTKMIDIDESSQSDLGSLPELPEEVIAGAEKSPRKLITHKVYRCEPNYTSSPCHGSFLSPRTKLTSSSGKTSPRHICSRLLLPNRIHTSRESLWAKRRRKHSLNQSFNIPEELGTNLTTIKSSTFATNISSRKVQKVLERFQQLRTDD